MVEAADGESGSMTKLAITGSRELRSSDAAAGMAYQNFQVVRCSARRFCMGPSAVGGTSMVTDGRPLMQARIGNQDRRGRRGRALILPWSEGSGPCPVQSQPVTSTGNGFTLEAWTASSLRSRSGSSPYW